VATDKFFDEQGPQSAVKAEIVEKYFNTWAKIIIATQKRYNRENRVGYIDLFAGPGRYQDGAVSTPLRVLTTALEDPDLTERLVTIFNDKDDDNVRTLETEIGNVPGIGRLKYKPEVWNREVGDEIAKDFNARNTIPLLAFIDPWGYKGLTLRLVNAFLKSWGCDCIFFFNYSRINAGLSNPFVREHMAALFGDERAARLKEVLEPMHSADREATIVNELALALREHGSGDKRFVLPFCFKKPNGGRTTHHLILVTKHFKGYEVMKGIMAKASSEHTDGVPSFTYSPATSPRQLLLYGLNQPLEALRTKLLLDLAGQTVTMAQLYEKHSVDTPYIRANYVEVLRAMERERAISTVGRKSPAGFTDGIAITFPPLK